MVLRAGWMVEVVMVTGVLAAALAAWEAPEAVEAPEAAAERGVAAAAME